MSRTVQHGPPPFASNAVATMRFRLPSFYLPRCVVAVMLVVAAAVQCLRDRSLPVQIEAASSLRYLIELDEAEEPVLKVLPDILNEYFRIMQEIGLDEVRRLNEVSFPFHRGLLCLSTHDM